MAKQIVVWQARASGMDFGSLYSEISDHWQEKARQLQQRRWRKLRNEIKERGFKKRIFQVH